MRGGEAILGAQGAVSTVELMGFLWSVVAGAAELASLDDDGGEALGDCEGRW